MNPPQTEKFTPATLADYQTGSVVSRSVLKRETGNVTFFAFSKGERLSSHSAPFDALVQVLEGRAGITIGEKKYSLSTGEAIVMPANIPHAVDAEENFKMLLTMIKG